MNSKTKLTKLDNPNLVRIQNTSFEGGGCQFHNIASFVERKALAYVKAETENGQNQSHYWL